MSAPLPKTASTPAEKSPVKCFEFERHSGENTSFSDTLELPYEGRLLRRKRLVTQSGQIVLLDLTEVTNLHHLDILILDNGQRVRIIAAAEKLLAVSGENLPRLAWHIGNRHTPCQIEQNRLLILFDHVLADMLAHLGATVTEVVEPFTPEGGAYGHGRTFGHSHGPADQAHEHSHSDGNTHDHAHGLAHSHTHHHNSSEKSK